MTLCGTYAVSSIDEIVNAINQLHISFPKHVGILSGKHIHCYKDNISER